MCWFLMILVWMILTSGAGMGVIALAPLTPLGWMTVLLIGLSWLTHIVFVLMGRRREALIIPTIGVAQAVLGYGLIASLPALMPELLEADPLVSAIVRWLIGTA